MRKVFHIFTIISVLFGFILSACQPLNQPTPAAGSTALKVLAVESFLADITQNVAGNRATVESLIPIDADPHSFEATPQDVARITNSQVLVINGSGFESWLDPILKNNSSKNVMIEASKGLTSRKPLPSELAEDHGEGDPHFWLDPIMTIHYVEQIRDGLSSVDPDGKDMYAANAKAYIAQLNELDGWIKKQVEQVPTSRRLLVTNHETLGYFADRYQFQVIGAIVPSVTTGASPSAQQLTSLVNLIRQANAPAIFLEKGVNAQLADQVSKETGTKVVLDLYTHSISAPDGPAPTYLEMMHYNTNKIVDALK